MAAAIDRRSRYLRDFAHTVSHEFKTPLAGIRGAIELLQDHPDMAATNRRRFSPMPMPMPIDWRCSSRACSISRVPAWQNLVPQRRPTRSP